MAESDQFTNYSLGVKPTEPPTVPVAGQREKEDKPEEKGIPVWVKVAGALITIAATIAGIIFGVQQLVQSNRTYQHGLLVERQRDEEQRRQEEVHRQEAEHTFALQMETMRAQNEKERLTLSVQQATRDAELAKAEAEKRAADAKIADSARLQAEADARKNQSELDKTDLQIKREQVLEDKKTEVDRKKQETEQFKELQAAIIKLRLIPAATADFATIGTITEFLTTDGLAKHSAIEALESRLEIFPTRAETDFIFNALPDAGFLDTIDVAIRANRRAWKVLGAAVVTDLRVAMNAPSIFIGYGSVGNQKSFKARGLITGTVSTPSAQNSVRRKFGAVLKGRTNATLYQDFDRDLRDITEELEMSARGPKTSARGPETSEMLSPRDFEASDVPSLDSVVGMLLASRLAIERLLAIAPAGANIPLDDCFLPNLSPELATRASVVSLRGAYLAGADLRPLDPDSLPRTQSLRLNFHKGDRDDRFLSGSAGVDPEFLIQNNELSISLSESPAGLFGSP